MYNFNLWIRRTRQIIFMFKDFVFHYNFQKKLSTYQQATIMYNSEILTHTMCNIHFIRIVNLNLSEFKEL